VTKYATVSKDQNILEMCPLQNSVCRYEVPVYEWQPHGDQEPDRVALAIDKQADEKGV
jgi:hypothetical protein